MATDDGNTRLCQWLPGHFSRRRSSTSGSPSSLPALEITRQQAIEQHSIHTASSTFSSTKNFILEFIGMGQIGDDILHRGA